MTPEFISRKLIKLLTDSGLSMPVAMVVKSIILILILFTLAAIANFIAKKGLLKIIKLFVLRTKNKYDDIFLKNHVFDMLSHLAPAVLIYILIPFVAKEFYVDAVRKLSYIYIIIVVLRVLNKTLASLHEIYKMLPASKNGSIQGYLQVIKIFFASFAIILIFSVIFEKSPFVFLTGLGAMTAVLLLIFKDTILGFVAGIQLSANKMVKPGDWITVPGKKADGDVLEITLNTVKIQNFDKTITTIPTYSLVTEAFTNWTGMSESGGRRIKRAVNIDINTIEFCSDEMLKKFETFELLKEYIAKKKAEINYYNSKKDEQEKANIRQFTNIGIFRIYLQNYLESKTVPIKNKKTHNALLYNGQFAAGMTLLVRQLPPSPTGLPIELYAFAATTAWAEYETIQADLFDHVLAIIPEFGLRIFQNPTGGDFKNLL